MKKFIWWNVCEIAYETFQDEMFMKFFKMKLEIATKLYMAKYMDLPM